MDRVLKKFKNAKGETIAEALIASFIAGIGLLILATMIRVSHQMVDNSNKVIDTFYAEVNQIEKKLLTPKSGTVTIVSLRNQDVQIDVNIYKVDKSELAMYSKKDYEANENETK